MKRGRKPGGKLVYCPFCNARIIVHAGEGKSCTNCERWLMESEVHKAIRDVERMD